MQLTTPQRARNAHPLLFVFTAFFAPAGAMYSIVLAAMNLVNRRDRVLWDTCVRELSNKADTAGECSSRRTGTDG